MRVWMKDARIKAGLTYAQAAEALNISEVYYGYIENGRRIPSMTIQMAARISEVFQIPLEEIIANELKGGRQCPERNGRRT